MTERLRPLIPLTALNTLWMRLDKKALTILDVGCGKGKPMKFINRQHTFRTIGVDVFVPYLIQAKKAAIHDDYVRCDVRVLPFSHKIFDVAISVEVLEHLDKTDGLKLISEMERVSKKEVIFTTPVNTYDQEPYDDNPFQEHKHVWVPSEAKCMGYTVIGTGVMGVAGDSGISSKVPKLFQGLITAVYLLFGCLTYFRPSLSGDMVCIKLLGD